MSYTYTRSFKRKYPHVVQSLRYAEDVLSGKIDACLYVRQACERQLTDLDRDNFLYAFSVAKAEAICAYEETLPHVKGVWARRGELLRLEPWQSFGLTAIFGWVYREDVHDDFGHLVARAGLRRFRSVYEEVPRKNAKSTKVAGVGLFMLEHDDEPGAEIYSSATTRKQAKIVFDVARAMAKRGHEFDVRAHTISNLRSASKFEALHAQGETLDGLNIHCAINDEVHAWKKRAVYDVIETAMGAREQPMIYNITTAGDNLEGICFQIRGYVIRVLKGEIKDDSFFGIIYTIDDDDKDHWLEPALWRKANPNFGVSVGPLDMEKMATKARELPSEQNAFLTKRLNVWTNASVAWMDMISWGKGFDSSLSLDQFVGEHCTAGIDLASKIDINSMALFFTRLINGVEHYYIFMRHWLPEAAIKGDRWGNYDGWVRSGAIIKTPGNVVDVDMIEEETLKLDKKHSIDSLGVDPGHNSTQYGVHMAEEGIEVVDVRPNWMNFSEPMKWLEAWVKDGRVHHNCKVLDWMMSNVVAKLDNKDNLFPKKENKLRKIDGVIALLIAINRFKMADNKKLQYTAFVM